MVFLTFSNTVTFIMMNECVISHLIGGQNRVLIQAENCISFDSLMREKTSTHRLKGNKK